MFIPLSFYKEKPSLPEGAKRVWVKEPAQSQQPCAPPFSASLDCIKRALFIFQKC
jgi:hypothetical protein